MDIRLAKPEERDLLVDFQVAMARETEDMALDAKVVSKGVQALFDDPGKGRYWLAEEDGEVLGCTLTIPEWSDWRNGTVLWIHSVFVPKEHRRKGVYRTIYAHLKSMVEQDESLKGLRLYVDKRNHPAAAAYQALGMTDEHYTLFEWLKNG